MGVAAGDSAARDEAFRALRSLRETLEKRQQRGSGGSGGAKAATAAAAEPEMPPGADRPGWLRLAAPKKGEGGGAHERE